MISAPAFYYRQCQNDVTAQPELKNRIQSVLSAALPVFLLLFSEMRIPIVVGCGALRHVVHIQEIWKGIQAHDSKKIGIHSTLLILNLITTALIISSTVSPYINPSYGIVAGCASDIITNISYLTNGNKNKKQIAETLLFLVSSLLYTSFLSFGYIEILATCMLIQIALNLNKSIEEFRKGHYIEGVCYLITSAVTLKQVIPQFKVIQWKWSSNPMLEGTLCQDKRGFVYIKVKDEIIYELHEAFGDGSIPPYFGKGKFGAHITVIPLDELPKGVTIAELGKTFKFNIAFFDSLHPTNFKGVDRVSFLSLYSPELDTFRMRYGLTPKVHKNHDWHITFEVHYEN